MLKAVLSMAGAAVFAYALGSVSFAIIISELFIKRDIRKYGSGNAGMTNVIRSVGLLPGLITFILDFSKGALAAYVGRLAFAYAGTVLKTDILTAAAGALLCGAVCQLGHIYPLFFGFKGGKGVATAAGIILLYDYRVFISCMGLFLVLFLISRIISLGSVIAAFSIPVAVLIFCPKTPAAGFAAQLVLSALIAFIIIIKHKDNIARLMRGEEKPLKAKMPGKNKDKEV